jgi:hypothetical protein
VSELGQEVADGDVGVEVHGDDDPGDDRHGELALAPDDGPVLAKHGLHGGDGEGVSESSHSQLITELAFGVDLA